MFIKFVDIDWLFSVQFLSLRTEPGITCLFVKFGENLPQFLRFSNFPRFTLEIFQNFKKMNSVT